MKEKLKKALKRLSSVITAAAMAFSVISSTPGGTMEAEAAQNQKVVKIAPVNCGNVRKILPEPTEHYAPDQTGKNFNIHKNAGFKNRQKRRGWDGEADIYKSIECKRISGSV